MDLQKKNNNKKHFFADSYSINEDIKSSIIRLIGEDGSQLGICSKKEALFKAKQMKLDLVEVFPVSNPSVCKLMNYGKFKYKQKQKTMNAHKTRSVLQIKEIKFRPKIDVHDFMFKVNNLKKFILQGKKVKISIVFRGREVMHLDIGRQILNKVLLNIKQYATPDALPKMDGKQLIVILSSIKGKKHE